MKIKSIRLNSFKRFTDLTIQNIPDAVKLVVLTGPNGCGKSSVFEAFHSWRWFETRSSGMDPEYHHKMSAPDVDWMRRSVIEFHYPTPATEAARRKAVYVRSAYRNEPAFKLENLDKQDSAIENIRIGRLIDNESAVSNNYQRLVASSFAAMFETEPATTTVGEFREKAIGEIRKAFGKLFPDLQLNSLGDPLREGTFKFDKGSSLGFPYLNLSGGEKAVFDLLLDLIVMKAEFDDTVFCIDEPEAHMNTRLQSALLQVIYDLVPENSQLWLATHSIGMMRRARDISIRHPGAVAFLDFDGRDFDKPEIIEPETPTRSFWHRVLSVALDDLSELVAPSRVVICEGRPIGTRGRHIAVDAKCYDQIFAVEFPDTRFLSCGNSTDVEDDRLALIEALKALVNGTQVLRLIDRDDHSLADIEDKRRSGVRVLARRSLESYLFDDEILVALCSKLDKMDRSSEVLAAKAAAIAASSQRGNPTDDMKSAAGTIYTETKRILQLTRCGNDWSSFMRSTLAPLVTPSTAIYRDLRTEIFGV